MSKFSSSLKSVKEEISQKNLSDVESCFLQLFVFPENCDENRRSRYYTFTNIFWLFLFQVLHPDVSCREAVLKAINFFISKKQEPPSPNNGSYCKARIKFPIEPIKKILNSLAEPPQEEIRKESLWCNREVEVADGTTLKLPDSTQNQKAYPQPDSQKPGCGYPQMRLLAFFSLMYGTIVRWNSGSYQTSEKALFRSLLDEMDNDKVFLADRGFGSYADYVFFQRRGVNFVIRDIEKQRKNFEVLKSNGKRDKIVKLYKPASRPSGIDKETWDAMPEEIVLRRVTYSINRKYFRTKKVTILTDLFDTQIYPAKAFRELYMRRWRAELFLRDIKTTMGMEQLKCKSPEMVEKELYMHIIAYNLIRNLIYKAAVEKKEDPERISFKGAVDLFAEFIPEFEKSADDPESFENLMEWFFKSLVKMKNPHRPGRKEPRAIKKRPKPYQYLTQHRSKFQEVPHRGKRLYC